MTNAGPPGDPEAELDLREPLKRLVLLAGGGSADFDAIRAWIDPETLGFHENLAPNRAIPFITALRAIPDLDQGLLETEYEKPGLEALLTTHPERVNINTAAKEVLEALWDDHPAAQRALDRRSRDPFRTVAEIHAFLDSGYASSYMRSSASVLAVASDFFTVRVWPEGSGVSEELAALVRREGEKVQILHIRRCLKEASRE